MRKFRKAGPIYCGGGELFESSVECIHPETFEIGENVYVGHHTMLVGHPNGKLIIGRDTWIGPNVYMNSAGNITIGDEVGIGPYVSMSTSYHEYEDTEGNILDSPLVFRPIKIEDGVDIGICSIILPGVLIEKGAQIGAGSVVTRSIPKFSIAAGNPARILRQRKQRK